MNEIPVGIRRVCDGLVAQNAGVVDHNVDAAKVVQRSLHQLRGKVSNN